MAKACFGNGLQKLEDDGMKRSLRVATGLLVLLTMVFSMGLTQNAYAAGEPDKPQKKAIASYPWGSADQGDQPDGEVPVTNTATTDTQIKSSTTVGTKTYNSNVVVFPGATLTVGTNATVTINGDLVIGGSVVMSSGTLKVNGDIINFANFTVKGTAKVIVSKAPVVNGGQYGGSLVVTDSADFGAIMTVSGSANITVNYAQYGGLYIQDNGRIKMDTSTTKITVNNDCYFAGASTNAMLTAGTLEIINGGFYQAADYSDYSFCASPNFIVSMKGTNSTPRYVDFETPLRSFFCRFTTSGMTFDDFSVISIKRDLAADWSLNLNRANLYFQGDLCGYKLTVTAESFSPTEGNELVLTNGTLTVNGTLHLQEYSRLQINGVNDKVIVNGAVLFESIFPATFTKGLLELNGNFRQINYDITPGEYFTVRMIGQYRSVNISDPDTSYFTNFELAPGASLNQYSDIPIQRILQNDITLPALPNLSFRGDLNGHTLQVNGDLTVLAGKTLTVGGGTLNVDGDLTISGDLVMSNANDKVVVAEDYNAFSDDASTNLTNGKLYISGDFAQYGNATSFLATGSHTTILNGSESQSIYFDSTSSRFASLVVLNDDVDPALIPAQYDSIAVSGTSFKGITPSAGALAPVFGSEVNEYAILLPAGTDSVTITPEFLDRYAGSAWMTEGDGTDHITSVTVNAVPYDGSKTVVIKAHAAEDAKVAEYTFKVMQINPDLSGLGTLPTGAVLEPAFDPAVTTYTVNLPESVGSLTFAPQADHPDSTVHIGTANGPATEAITVDPGETNKVTRTVIVVAQDGTTEGTYTVTFTRRNPLTGINVSAGTLTPAFSAGTTAYTVNVPTNVPSVTVTALKADTDPDWSKFEIDDVEQNEITVALAVGESKTVTIEAWDADGTTVSTYTVELTRVSMLEGITLSAGMLTPAFSPDTDSYTVQVPSTTTSVKVTPVKTPACTSMKINGTVASYATLNLALGGKATATIECTNGTGDQAVTQTYTVTIYRVAPITGITITGGTLSPAFVPTTAAYTVSVPATTASVTVKPTVSADCSDMQMDGQAVASVTLTPAIGGSAVTVITGTGLDGVVKTYTVTVKRAALITGITPAPGTLSPAFKATTLDYTVTVPYTTEQVKITPVKTTGVKYLYINGVSTTYAYIKPPLGGSAKAVIKAVATDGKTAIYYSVTVKRTGLISRIDLSGGATLTPAFVGSTAAYTVNLPVTSSSVTITPVKTSSCKSFTINGKAVTSAVITPTAGTYATCTVAAIGLDGTNKSTYTIKVYRHRPITGIGLSAGTLTPAFSSTRLEYDVTIPGDTPSITITPTRTTGYNYSINGGTANTPATINVAPNSTETASIVAAYAGGSLTYTVNVHRAGLLTGIAAVNDDTDPVALDFSSTDTDYVLEVAADVDEVVVTPTAVSGATFTIDGDTVASKAIAPAIGGSATATILVTSGEEQMTYTVTVQRAAAPENILSISGALEPVFDNEVFDYEIHLDHATGPDSVVLNFAASGDCSIQTSGLTATKPATPGFKVATIVLTPAGGLTVTYTVKIYWDIT